MQKQINVYSIITGKKILSFDGGPENIYVFYNNIEKRYVYYTIIVSENFNKKEYSYNEIINNVGKLNSKTKFYELMIKDTASLPISQKIYKDLPEGFTQLIQCDDTEKIESELDKSSYQILAVDIWRYFSWLTKTDVPITSIVELKLYDEKLIEYNANSGYLAELEQ